MSRPQRSDVPSDPPAFVPFALEDSARIYDSKWVGLRRDTVVLPDGSHGEYHVVEISDAVVVVPVLRDGSVMLIAQYRYPHGKTHWEVPAGRIHPGETPLQAAERELREETGCVAARFAPLPGFYPINGISAHYAHAFVALGCEERHALQLDRSEQIATQRFSREEVRRLLSSGRVADAFTALSLFHYFDREAELTGTR